MIIFAQQIQSNKNCVRLRVAGLERVAEELMGRRRWRQYQGHILGESAISKHETQTAWEKRSKEEIVKEEEVEEEQQVEAAAEEAAEPAAPDQDLPKDWQPEDRCYFCDGAVHTEPCRVSLVNPALCVALCVDHKK